MPNEIKLYGVIGEDVTAVQVKSKLDAMDQSQPLVVRIHSEGGSVPDGLAIYDAFRAYSGPKRAVIESAAFSIASHIAMAFEDVEITENGYLMIHNPHMEVGGDDVAHAQAAECLSKLKESMVAAYSAKTGKSREEVLAVMAAESWINAREALAGRYVSRITPPKQTQLKAVALVKNMPQGVLESLRGGCPDAGEKVAEEKGLPMSEAKPVAASLAEIKAAFPKAKAEFVLSCLEKSLPLASVMTEALAAMDEELQQCKAKLAEYENAAKAKAETETETVVEEEKPAEAKAQAKAGVKPVAKAPASAKPSARVQWADAIAEERKAGTPTAKAASIVNKKFPGLRESMLAEVNATN